MPARGALDGYVEGHDRPSGANYTTGAKTIPRPFAMSSTSRAAFFGAIHMFIHQVLHTQGDSIKRPVCPVDLASQRPVR